MVVERGDILHSERVVCLTQSPRDITNSFIFKRPQLNIGMNACMSILLIRDEKLFSIQKNGIQPLYLDSQHN